MKPLTNNDQIFDEWFNTCDTDYDAEEDCDYCEEDLTFSDIDLY